MNAASAQRSFVEQLDRHRAILFKVAAVYCRNAPDREDLTQEIIAQMWRSYRRFDGRCSFSTWMYRIAMNVATSFVRSETRTRRRLVYAEASVVEHIAISAASDTDARLELLYDSIDALEPLDRALMLLFLDDRPHSEIAAILGISESNVGTKIGRIKERLRRRVADNTSINGGESDGIR